MPVFTREAYYRTITETIKEELVCSPTNAVRLLSSFFKEWAKTPHPEGSLLATYQWLETQLSIEEKRKLWQALSDLTPGRYRVPWQRAIIKSFKESLLQSVAFVSAASLENLLAIGHDPYYYRLTFIALVRKHLQAHQLDDPFSEGFSSELLQSESVEQNRLTTSPYLSRCASLPIDWIVQLAVSEEVALLLFLECRGTPFVFEVGKGLAERHPGLRARIAEEWHTWIALRPMSEAQEAFLARELPRLKACYPEFQRIPEVVSQEESRYSSPITTSSRRRNSRWGCCWCWQAQRGSTPAGERSETPRERARLIR